MRKLLLVGMLFSVTACATSITEDEYVKCEHLYDKDRTILTKHSNNIQEVSVSNCPEIVRYESGKCPPLVKIVTLDQKVVWLTKPEFENYKCIQIRND